MRKLIGLQLASTVFFAGIIVPQVNAFTASINVTQNTQKTLLVQDTQTKTTFQWPLTSFGISQYYKFYHPALDLTTVYDDPVLAIASGTVESIGFSNWGYGRFIIIKHENGYSSLYAHLSQILINIGDAINQGAKIGTVGSSGWSTGTHLHLEISGPEGTLNPLDVLPKQENTDKTG